MFIISNGWKAANAASKAKGGYDTAQSGKNAIETANDPNSTTGDKINAGLDVVEKGANTLISPPGTKLVDTTKGKELVTKGEEAMNKKTKDGKDIQNWRDKQLQEFEKESEGGDDSYQLLNPGPSGSDDKPSKDKPQTDNDSKSAWEKFVENFIEKPLEWLGWKDKDTPESQPTEPNGQGENDPTGLGNGNNDNPNNPNSNPEPLQVPGAGGGFGAGLGNGNGSGTKDLGDPKTPFYDPLLIALQTGGNNTSISVVSHNEENGGKMLDLNGDGIANNVSWIGKDTGVLFYDENNNHKMDGIACNDKLYFQAA